MTLDPKGTAALALHRFGFGPRAGTIAAIAADPRGALLAELDKPNAGRIADGDVRNSGAAARAFFEFRAERRAKQIVAQREAERQRAMAGADTDKPMAEVIPDADVAPNDAPPNSARRIVLDEAKARLQ